MSLDPTAFVHPLALVLGDVTLGPRASIWPMAVVRGDSDSIAIGAESNIQDGAVLHTDPGLPMRIGARVAIGHRAIVHGATVDDNVLVGMGAILLNGSHVGQGSLVAAGAVVREGQRIPANSLVVGVPGRVLRETTEEERARIARTVASYLRLQERHRAGEFPSR
jgi:carbonic anhydrase/acetyltransferase-like protein (isoleucine patch superfamily)